MIEMRISLKLEGNIFEKLVKHPYNKSHNPTQKRYSNNNLVILFLK
jgi:hypothetical protein